MEGAEADTDQGFPDHAEHMVLWWDNWSQIKCVLGGPTFLCTGATLAGLLELKWEHAMGLQDSWN